jgi:hypothetical protein
MLDSKSNKPMLSRLSTEWRFLDAPGIRSRKQNGKLQLSPEKTAEMERAVAAHLGLLKRGFDTGDLDEDQVENRDETHFVVYMDNGRKLSEIGEKNVKYADVVSGAVGGMGMTMFVRLSHGT